MCLYEEITCTSTSQLKPVSFIPHLVGHVRQRSRRADATYISVSVALEFDGRSSPSG